MNTRIHQIGPQNLPTHPAIHSAITPLRMIFWGGLLCVLDFKFNSVTNGSGFSFDILNDALGVILILTGVLKLLKIPAGPEAQHAPSGKLAFAAFAAAMALAKAIHGHLIYRVPEGVTGLLLAVGLLSLVAIVTFCVAMQDMCRGHSLHHSAREWLITTWLFVFIYLIPLGFLYIAIQGSAITGSPMNVNAEWVWLLLIIPAMLVPLISFYLSTSSMVKEIRDLPAAARMGGANPASLSLSKGAAGKGGANPASLSLSKKGAAGKGGHNPASLSLSKHALSGAEGGAGESTFEDSGIGPAFPYENTQATNAPHSTRQWTVRDDPLPPKHPGATNRVV